MVVTLENNLYFFKKKKAEEKKMEVKDLRTLKNYKQKCGWLNY